MRLLSLNERGELAWKQFSQNEIPSYAILSHTWGTEEVTFADLVNGQAQGKAGYRKIAFCGEQATRDGLRYFWVDTCCIDKRDSTELSKSINSMFRWYRNAVKCYVYLSDVSTSAVGVSAENCQSAWETDFRKSRWFKRGWTLQELLAPSCVEFYSAQHQRLGSKESLCPIICKITGISMDALQGHPLKNFTIEERLTWASERQTTEVEDEAYCLLGLFGVFMPLIYGEGRDHALKRLLTLLDGHPVAGTVQNATSGDVRRDAEACLRSLGFANLDARQNEIADVHPGTCDWFFETDEFCKWRDRVDLSANNGVLWLKGKPGAGKSTLMKHVFRYCKDKFDNQLVISYFFTARGDQLEKTYLGMLRSITYQLIQTDSTVQGRFFQYFREKQMISQEDKLEWRPSDLRDIVTSELGHRISRPVVLLIDALDECSETDVCSVIGLLENLSIKAYHSGTMVRICLSSRHYPSIGMKKNLELILEDKSEHQNDIVSYVRDKLDSKIEEFQYEIEWKSNGVFLWAILVVAMLNKASYAGQIEVVEKTLNNLPDDLEDVFNTILGDDETNKAETVLMLQWVLLSERPTRTEELFFGVMTEVAPELQGPWDRTQISSESMERRIIDSSKGLIEIRKEDHASSVQFIHQSVNDFLHRNQRLRRLDPTLGPDPYLASYKRLWSCCQKYIQQFDMTRKGRREFFDVYANYPFLACAVRSVFCFADNALPSNIYSRERNFRGWWFSLFYSQPRLTTTENDVLQWLRGHGTWNVSWQEVMMLPLMIHHDAFVGADGELMYFCALGGWQRLMQLLLVGTEMNVNAQVGEYGNALQAASFCGSREIVQMLLDAGADVNAQGGEYGNALRAASFHGSREIVQMLLDAGADVNAQGGKYGNALQAASFHEWRETMQLLVDAGADVNALKWFI